MTMSSRDGRFESLLVADHGPEDVDPPSSQSYEGLGVPFTLRTLAVVERPGRRRTQAGEGRLVEDPLEHPVSAAHPPVVPRAGVAASILASLYKTRGAIPKA